MAGLAKSRQSGVCGSRRVPNTSALCRQRCHFEQCHGIKNIAVSVIITEVARLRWEKLNAVISVVPDGGDYQDGMNAAPAASLSENKSVSRPEWNERPRSSRNAVYSDG